MFLLSPQANTGSYVNGAWSPTGSMNESRLFFTTDMLPNGNVFAVGGEYPKFSNTAEIYNSVTGVLVIRGPRRPRRRPASISPGRSPAPVARPS